MSTTPSSRNTMKDRGIVVFGAAFVLRLLLTCLFPALPDLLTGRVEVSTPVNSFKRRTCLPTVAPGRKLIHLSPGRSVLIYEECVAI